MHDRTSPLAADATEALFRRVSVRLIPILFVLYVAGFLDRINVGFAKLSSMPADLGLSEAVYGFGAGIFFLGYFLFEVPSNLILERVGARKWVARIMLTWGVLASAMMFVRGAASFYALRFLLGAAEAGFFPGMVLYLTYWYPAQRRAKATASFLTATAIAGVIGAPISSGCLLLDGRLGLHGWQWLFLLEGIPSVLLGVAVLLILPDGPRSAGWLSDAEKALVADALARDGAAARHQDRHDLLGAVADPRLWLLSAIYFLLIMGLYGFSFWAPDIIRAAAPLTMSRPRVACLCAIPYCAGAALMVVIGRNSDRTGERHWHVAGPALLGAAGWVLTAFAPGLPGTLAALSLAAVGVWGVLGTFWSLPTSFLRGSAAAGGIAIINSIGCLAGQVSPWVLGLIRGRTHHFTGGLLCVAAAMAAGGVLVFTVRVARGEEVARTED